MRMMVSALALAALVGGAGHAATFVQKDTATLRALDKITGRSTDIDVKVGEPVVFGSLKVELQVCYQTPPEEAPESAAFLKIASTSVRRGCGIRIEFGLYSEGVFQEFLEILTGYFDKPELLQVGIMELRVEQDETVFEKMRHQMDQRNL